jgi:uncharacterized membrane protein YraQ (UPF0718 family)/copper chaperone CopZ
MYDILVKTILESWQVLGQMAPYLLLGFLVAGVLSVSIPPEWVERHLGRRGFGSVWKASLLGVPLPLCSCGVIPVSASIRRHGASRAATVSFLLSTPQTGVDSIAVTYALLGPVFAIFRPVAALVTGLFGGGLAQLLGEANGAEAEEKPRSLDCTDACCADEHDRGKLLRALRYGFVTLPRDLGLALLVGIIIAGAMAALVPQDRLEAYIGGGISSILLLMAAGVPLYICATASVPIAAGLMYVGASPGAALAFLIAGPATNAAAFTSIWKVLGRRTAIVYLITVGASAVACGLLFDWLVPALEATLPAVGSHAHAIAEGGWFYHAAALLLLAVLGFSYLSTRPPESATEEVNEGTAVTPNQGHRLELVVTGMTCGHCVQSVKRALVEITGVRSAEVSLANGRVVVKGDDLNREQLVAAVAGLGFAAKTPLEEDNCACGSSKD